MSEMLSKTPKQLVAERMEFNTQHRKIKIASHSDGSGEPSVSLVRCKFRFGFELSLRFGFGSIGQRLQEIFGRGLPSFIGGPFFFVAAIFSTPSQCLSTLSCVSLAPLSSSSTER